MSGIIEEARIVYQRLAGASLAAGLSSTALWKINIRDRLARGMELEQVEELAHFVQEIEVYAHPRTVDDPLLDGILDGYLGWLGAQGRPLASWPAHVAESPLGSPTIRIVRSDRPVSTHFLYHLCIAARLLDRVPRPWSRVLEIGAGYGGLTRLVKLLEPSVQYWIVDLPETIYFSYSFLRGNFPDAHCQVIFPDVDPGAIAAAGDADFVFVPTDAVDRLAGIEFDLAVNTASLGEMTQATVDRYFRLLEQETRTRYFYSLNRYGQFPATRVFNRVSVRYQVEKTAYGHLTAPPAAAYIQHSERFRPVPRTAGSTSCDYATPFDPYWAVLLWHTHGRDTFGQIEPECPPSLECLARRVPRRLLCDDYRNQVAENLLRAASARPAGDPERGTVAVGERAGPSLLPEPSAVARTAEDGQVR